MVISKRGRFGASAAVVIALLSRTGAADVVRLRDLEARALAGRPQLRAEHAEIAAARADAAFARSAYYPTIGVNADASAAPGGHLVRIADVSSRAEYLVAGSKTVGESNAFVPEARYGGTLALSSRLYDFGRTRSAANAADASVVAAAAGERAARDRVVNEVRAAYLDWLGAELLHVASLRALTNARSRIDVVKARIDTGTRPRSEMDPAVYDEKLAELDECESRRRVTATELSLERAVGAPLPENGTPDTTLLDMTPPKQLSTDTSEIVALSKQSAAAVAMAHFHDRENSPVLSASAEAGVRGQLADVFPTYRAAIALTVPIADGGAASARAARSRSEATAIEAREREASIALRSEHDVAANDWARGVERVRLAESLYAVAASRARDVADRYSLGQDPLERLLEADSAVTRAEREVLLARLARADAALRLTSPASSVSASPEAH
ncbi:MAG TPA: TolC family protein [Polyangiaceae bacterium]|nr:TolC family protein [Polyangiaceae bacterium]